MSSRRNERRLGFACGSWLRCGSADLRILVMLRFRHQESIGAAHSLPVVFVGGSAQQANLIVLAVAVQARPRESMGAISREESPQESHLCRSRARGSSGGGGAKRL